MRAQAHVGDQTHYPLLPMESHAITEHRQTTESHQSYCVTKYTSKLIN